MGRASEITTYQWDYCKPPTRGHALRRRTARLADKTVSYTVRTPSQSPGGSPKRSRAGASARGRDRLRLRRQPNSALQFDTSGRAALLGSLRPPTLSTVILWVLRSISFWPTSKFQRRARPAAWRGRWPTILGTIRDPGQRQRRKRDDDDRESTACTIRSATWLPSKSCDRPARAVDWIFGYTGNILIPPPACSTISSAGTTRRRAVGPARTDSGSFGRRRESIRLRRERAATGFVDLSGLCQTGAGNRFPFIWQPPLSSRPEGWPPWRWANATASITAGAADDLSAAAVSGATTIDFSSSTPPVHRTCACQSTQLARSRIP